MAEIGLMNYITLRKTCTLMVCLLCLALLSIYVASNGKRISYYTPDITFVDGNTIKRQYWQQHRFDNEINKGKGTGRQKQTAIISSRESTSSLINSSTANSEIESPNQGSFGSTSNFNSKKSLSTASVSSASSSSSSYTEISSTSGNSVGHQSDTMNNGLQRISPNTVYLNNLQDFNPIAMYLNRTTIKLPNNMDYRNKISANKTNESFESIEDIHKARIRRIKDVCRNKDLFTNMTYKGITTKRFYGSENYNFTYCKVPKSGSTFWTRTFGILRFGMNYGETMFRFARSKVHQSAGTFVKHTEQVITEKTRTIIVSRDPFSRLFSAYIDKSFILLMNKLNFVIRQIPSEDIKSGKNCPTDLSFQEFLDWIVAEGKRGKSLNRHWSPIVSLCLPCDVNSFLLVKQETFGKDVEYALKKVGVEKEKLDYIIPALHDHRAELSLPGIITTVFLTAHNTYTKNCLGYLKYSRRLWISFQIQGFIDEHKEFPLELFNQTNFANSTFFTEIVLQTLRDFPMSSEQRRNQRLRYLHQAYQEISPETIKGIQELYQQDFELFGYSNLPPTGSIDVQ